MYNEDIKKWFINENTDNKNSKAAKEDLFNKTEKYEALKDLDCSKWSTNDIIGFYKAVSTASHSVLCVYNSILSIYTDFCLRQCLVPDHQNHYKEITQETLYNCINSVKAKKVNCIRPVELIENIENIINPSDRFIIRALFEGVHGVGFKDILTARMSSFDGNKMKLSNGEIIDVSSTLVRYARESYKEDKYHALTGDENRWIGLVTDEDIIIKRKNNEKTESDHRAKTMGLRIARNLSSIGYKGAQAKTVEKSGMIYWCKIQSEKLNIDIETLLSTPKYRAELEKRFVRVQNLSIFLNECKEYL